jgi:hypothetical protein
VATDVGMSIEGAVLAACVVIRTGIIGGSHC